MAAVFLCFGSPLAAAPARVSLDAVELIGSHGTPGWSPMLVTLTNRTGEQVTGEVFAGSEFDSGRLRVRVTVDASSQWEDVVYFGPGWYGNQVCFEPDGGSARCRAVAGEGGNVLVLEDEWNLRAPLALADTSEIHYENASRVPPRIVTAYRHGRSGDLVVPDLAIGYASLRMVVAEVKLLDGLPQQERDALGQWVRSGGELVVVAGNGRDLVESVFVQEQLGELERGAGPGEHRLNIQLATFFPTWDDERFSYNGPGLEAAPYGTKRNAGLGLAHHVIVAAQSSDAASEEVQEQSQAALDALAAFMSRGTPALFSPVSPSTHSPYPDFSLDPNADARPPVWAYLLIVAAFATLAVIAQRRWAKSGKGVGRLVATALALAVVGCLLVFVLGLLVRGTGTRYRSMSWVEMAAGSSEGVFRRQTSLIFSSPREATVPIDERSRADFGFATTYQDENGLRVTVNGRQWETISGAEVGHTSLGGSVEMTRDGDTITITNNLPHTIEAPQVGDVLSDRWRHIEDLPPGQRATVDLGEMGAVRANLSLHGFQFGLWSDRRIGTRLPVALLGAVDVECSTRGDFEADGCRTTILVRGAP